MKRSDADIEQTARDRLAVLEAEVAELKGFLATAEKLRGGSKERPPLQADPSPPTPAREIRKRAAAILSAVDRPMQLAELHESLVRAGVVIGGKDERSNLSAKLSGAPEIETIPGKGWVIKRDEAPHVNGAAG